MWQKLGYEKTEASKNDSGKCSKGESATSKECISNGWWRKFMEGQPDISLCWIDSTAHVQMDSVNKDAINQ